MTDKEIVERAKEAEKRTGFGELVHSPISKGVNSAYGIGFIEGMAEYRNSLQQESVSEDLKEAANAYISNENNYSHSRTDTFMAGAKWQRQKDEHLIWQTSTANYEKGIEEGKQQMMKNIWKPADGEDLPEIDREVIALLDNGKVVFAHRPPEYWDGKNIITGKVTRHYPKTYDKGGWNIPNVKWWLDCSMPKVEED